ncbi:type I-E CRISPR-associated protein Cas6/Cse3/CasE [Streptomyces sp. ST1015]|uniref:type I-E CRISPR-associated protein Cas6/Cse3/CasE n=1 Tax=unclassified Streptomyces TaxID=2593676 RepID=UPI000DDAA609|nr:type I-E CRISPR-associated protein Cas6/Cse3/CasE [Streptomyces sp. ST1015]QZZ25435.1 type I-E CRISPR-associated protein Cas6/Cse3/CasE [Streptomyces sp. ST1015]
MTARAALARIRLNPRSTAVRRDLRDADGMHRTLMRMVPDGLGTSPRQSAGLLYRLDETENATTLLVQAAALDLTRLPDGYGHGDVKDLTPMFRALHPGRAVRYRIAVNPIKNQAPAPGVKGVRGKRVPLTGPEADQWWARRAAEAGLTLDTLVPTPLNPARRHATGCKPAYYQLVRYDGTATVTDPDALTRAVLTGIGRAKSYGAGLLSLAPAA